MQVVTVTNRTCPRCGIGERLARSNCKYLQPYCGICTSRQEKLHRSQNAAKYTIIHSRATARRFGHQPLRIAEDDLARILKSHDKRCDVCHSDISGHAACGKRKYRVDHDHKTGAFRGLLCNRCNVMLGSLENDPSLLGNMQEYLLSGGARQYASC